MHTTRRDFSVFHGNPHRRTIAIAVVTTAAIACNDPAAPAATKAPDIIAVHADAKKAAGIVAPTVYATGLDNPRGLRFGPDGYLYVAEGGLGGATSTVGQCPQVPPPIGPYLGSTTGSRISKIPPGGGTPITVAGNLPSSQTQPAPAPLVSGVADVEFIDGTLYGLLTGAGCSHGVPSIPNQVFRVNPDGSTTMIANLSTYYQTHPTARPEEDDFEPDGTPYSMVAVRGDLYVVEPNHGSLDRVSLDGSITRVVDISASQGHIVPTTVSYRGNFFVGNLNTFPVVPGSSKIMKINPAGRIHDWVTGLTAVLGNVWDNRGRLYVLEAMTAPGAPTPQTGRVLRVDPSGDVTTIADGLFFPTAITLGPDGNLYVSNFGFGPPPVGLGQILRIAIN
jgi:hypothetical protein